MGKIWLIVAVSLAGNIWFDLWSREEVKFTVEAACDLGSLADPDGCPRPEANGGGIFDPEGAQ